MLNLLSQRATEINPPQVVRVYKATVIVQGESITVREITHGPRSHADLDLEHI